MKKNNLYTVATTLNVMQLILSLCVVGVKTLDILGDFYVRISIFALEIFAWILVGMYLFIKYDIIGGKSAFKTAVISVTPVLILTVISALMGYLGDAGTSNWLGFAFLGSALSFYNKTAIILTNLIPVADAYLMFFANYAIIFISAFVGFILGSGSNKRIRKAKAKAEAEAQEPQKDLSMTQMLEKIDENAMQGISDEEDEKLTDVVLEESYDETEDDSTTAIISIDDDDDDSEILGQETVEIISLDVDELEDEAEIQLKQRYDDMPGTDDEENEDLIIEGIEDDIEETVIVDQLYDMDIEEDEDGSFEEMMNFVEENVTEENGWTFLSEEQSDELLRLANQIPASEITEDDDFDEAEGDAETEEVTFKDLVSIMTEDNSFEPTEDELEEAEGLKTSIENEEAVDVALEEFGMDIEDIEYVLSDADEYDDEQLLRYEPLTEATEEDLPLFTLAAESVIEDIEEDEPVEEIADVITEKEEIPEEIISSEEPVQEEIIIEKTVLEDIIPEIIEEKEDITEDIVEEAFDEIIEVIPEEEFVETIEESEETTVTAAESIVEDFSDITIEDIEIYVDMDIDEEDIVTKEETEVITPEFTDADEEYIDIDEVNDISDIDIDEILSEDPDLYEEDEEDIDEDEVKRLIRGEDKSAEEPSQPEIEEETDEKDELSIIADYVEAVAAKEQEIIVVKEKPEKKVRVVTEKQIKAQRDKEFDNWLNRKTARLDVKAIRDALKENEE